MDFATAIGLDLNEIAHTLRRTFAECPKDTRVVRVVLPVAKTDPLLWLSVQQDAPRIYWRDREGDFEMAGLGAVHTIFSDDMSDIGGLFATMREWLGVSTQGLRYYGGMRFAPTDEAATAHGPEWCGFGACQFVLPHIELLRDKNASWLAVNLNYPGPLPDETSVETIIDTIRGLDVPLPPGPEPSFAHTARHDTPDRPAWASAIERTVHEVQTGSFQKTVLARRTDLSFPDSVDALSVLRSLRATAGDCYLFAFQLLENATFLGASPERLYAFRDGIIRTEALAGTRRRGDSASSDAVLADALLHDEKELREHRFVMDCIRDTLETLCVDISADPALSLAKLASCQHLVYHYQGRLATGRTDADLLVALHPTPAVGGYPRDAALAWIREIEPFDRGWYAGPVGWVSSDSSEFALGIRSALVTGNDVSLYAGAGIVAGSTPDAEWDEIEAKIAAFHEVLGDEND